MPKSAQNNRGNASRPAGAEASAGRSDNAPTGFRPPLRPSRLRILIASMLYVVWVGVLVTLYLTAVLPEKQNRSSRQQPTSETQPNTIAR